MDSDKLSAPERALWQAFPRGELVDFGRDVFPAMLGSDGLPKPEIFVADKLHMNPDGYKIWTAVVRPFLAE